MVKEREDFLVIGRDLPKVEAEAKARGECKFAGDISLPDMLHGKILRSPHAHAIVKRINTSKAERLPGVKAVITHKDVPQQLAWRTYFFTPSASVRDNYILEKEVRYVGDRVAAVAAISPEIAEEALGLIEVEYELLPAVFDPIQAMQPDATLVHRMIKRGDDEIKMKNNILAPVNWVIGDVEEGFKQADLVVENEYRTISVHNAQMERTTVVCQPLPGGRLEVWVPTQNIHGTRIDLAKSLGIPNNKVKVHRLFCGGTFGVRSQASFIEAICGFLALQTRRPVRIELSREEMFLNGGRHPMVMRLKTGVKKDGTLTALDMHWIDDTGAYSVTAEAMLSLAAGFLLSMYRCPNMRVDGYTVYTNTPPRTAMRGVGNPQQNFAIEQQMDIIAEQLDMDPLELRLKNHVREGDTFYGQGPDVVCVVQSSGTEQLIKEGAKLIGWEHRKAVIPYTNQPWIKRGIGMARGFHTSSAASLKPSDFCLDYSGATVRVNENGTANLITPCADSGTGCLSAHAAMVAEVLGLRYEDVTVTEADTDFTHFDSGTHASRGVYAQGLAVFAASTNAKKIILDWAARILEVPADHLEARDRRIYAKTDPSIEIGIEEVLRIGHLHDWGTPIASASVRAPACPPHFTVIFVEVDVDTMTGEVKLVRAIGGADVGTVINPQAVRGQTIGGLHMGIGFALTEASIIDPVDGHVVNPNFKDYKLLTPLDMPKVETILANTYEPTGPFGAKGVGEGATNPVASAVANAIYNAVGARIYSLPMTPEKILEAIRNKQESVGNKRG